MYGTREFRFSYTDKDGQEQFLYSRNIWIAQKIVAERGGTNCQRAPLPKKVPETYGHCQICERQIASSRGKIAHHGYTRPGHGWQTASCFGAKWRPYEVACDALPPAIEGLSQYIENRERFVDEMISNPPEEIDYYTQRSFNKPSEHLIFKRPDNFLPSEHYLKAGDTHRLPYTDNDYCYHYRYRISQAQSEIRQAKYDLARLKKRLADWREPK